MSRPIFTFSDTGPDSLGRRSFVVTWTADGGIFRPEPHPDDGEPVGYRRAQHFHAVPEKVSASFSFRSPQEGRGFQDGPEDIQSPCERTRADLESRGYPEGVDYEALIMEEAEEEIDGW